jgi:hypothetical protein
MVTVWLPPWEAGAASEKSSGPVTGREPAVAQTVIVPYATAGGGEGAGGCGALGRIESAARSATIATDGSWGRPGSRSSDLPVALPVPSVCGPRGRRAYDIVVSIRSTFCVGAVALLTAACGSTAAPSSEQQSLANFRNAYVEFQYPTAWAAAQPDVPDTLHVHPMIYLSVQPTRNPCRTTGAETSCGWPVTRLRRGGVLVMWENRGYPGWSLESAPGTPIRVGGRRAHRQVSRPGACAAIGGDVTVEVAIARPLAGNWTAVTACLRKPNLAAAERELGVVLRSTRFKSP